MEAYDRAAKIVAPKIAALKAAEAEYNEVMGQLAVKQAALQVVSKCFACFVMQKTVESRLSNKGLSNVSFVHWTIQETVCFCFTTSI